MGEDVTSSPSTQLTPKQRRFTEAMLDLYGVLDILCGDYPEGIHDYHRSVAERMGITLPEAAAT